MVLTCKSVAILAQVLCSDIVAIMATKRLRAPSTGAVEEVLASYIDSSTKIVYGENFSNDKLDHPKLIKHIKFLDELKEAGGGKPFAQKELANLVEKVVGESQVVGEEHQASFGDVIAKRIRLMMRHLANARLKPTTPKWLSDYDGSGESEKRRRGTSSKDEKEDYFVGYNWDISKAYRQKGEEGKKEFTDELYVDKEHKLETDPVYGRWGSWTSPIAQLTVGAYQQKLYAESEASKRGGKAIEHWTGKTVDDEELKVVDRADRKALLSLQVKMDGKWKQRAQIVYEYFATESEAVELMIGVAKDIAAGKITLDAAQSTCKARVLKVVGENFHNTTAIR